MPPTCPPAPVLRMGLGEVPRRPRDLGGRPQQRCGAPPCSCTRKRGDKASQPQRQSRTVETGIPARFTAAEGRRFGLGVGGAFVALGALSAWRGRLPMALGFAVIGGVLLMAGRMAPARLEPVYRGWMALAHALSKLTTPIFLGVLYFAVFAPLGIILRLVGRRPLARPTAAQSRWIACDSDSQRRQDMERQF